MRNVNRVAVSPRSKIWADLAAQTPWRFYSWRGAEGSGAILTEVNGLADTAAYSGTAPSWTNPEYGPAPGADGGWVVPVSVENMFDLSVPRVAVFSCWLTLTASDVEYTGSQECILNVGVDNETESNGPVEGHYRIEISEGSSQILVRTIYRNAGASNASVPAGQELFGSSTNIESDGATNKQVHIGNVLYSDGTTVSYAQYVDGVQDRAGSYTVDGVSPMALTTPAASRFAIGAKVQNASGTLRSTARLGESSSGAKIRAIVVASKASGTQAEGISLVQELYKYPNEAPRGLA